MDISPGSSLLNAINARYGDASKTPGIFRRLRGVENAKHLAVMLRNYVDERKKRLFREPGVEGHDDADYSERVVDGAAPQRPGVDFIPGAGTVRVFGYLNQVLLGAANAVDAIPVRDQIEYLLSWWLKSRPGTTRLAHHLLFSLDPRDSATLGELRVPIDDVLAAASTDALFAFNQRFWPNASLGWVLGFHHDRHHVHAHALLYPVTSAGDPINISDSSKLVIPGGERIRVDFLSALSRAYISVLPAYVNAAKLSAMSSPQGRAAVICRNARLLGAARSALETEKGDEPIFMRDVAERSLAMLQTADRTVPESVTEENKLPERDELHPDDCDVFVKALTDVARETNALVSRIRSKRESLAADFETLRRSEGAYRMIQYAPGTPLFSPSGTRRFLGIRPDRDTRWFTWSDVQDLLDARLSIFDREIERQRAKHRMGVSVPEGLATKASILAQHAFLAGYEVLRGMSPCRLHDTPFGSASANFANRSLLAAERSSQLLRSEIAEAAMRNAARFHTASFDELSSLYRMKYIARKLGKPEPNEEDVYLPIPQSRPLIPATPNFMEREGSSAGLRDLATMQKEIQDLTEQLTKAMTPDRVAFLPSFTL